MKKKHLLILLLACVASISASAYDFKVDGIYYNESGIEASVTYKNEKYNSYSGSVTIPASVTYNNVTYSVTSIGDGAFESCTNLTSVTIPNSVTSIGISAFYECRSLTSVTIPNSVTSIGSWAFRDCGVLTSVTIGNSVTSIGNLAFYGCGDLTSVTIPNSVITIGDMAFRSCTSLTSVTIPESVTSIGDWAFKNCSGLTSVTIPNSVTSIGEDAFYGTALYDNDSNWENKVLYIGNHLIRAATDLTDEYTIKDGTVTIAGNAFFECSDLTSVTIPNSVITIGDSAFFECYELTAVTIPNSVTLIGDSAFRDCRFTSVTIPESVTSIGNLAFYGCSRLSEVIIPDSVTSIGCNAFEGTALYDNDSNWENNVLYICNHLIKAKRGLTGSYEIKDGTVTIANNAFEYLYDHLTSITFPNSVTSIGYEAFYGCDGLTSVIVDNNNPANISLGDDVFYAVPASTCILYVPKGSKELYAVADQWKDFVNIEEFVSGVENVLMDNEFESEVSYYDLMGRRVVNPTNGIYIRNGKKVLVK